MAKNSIQIIENSVYASVIGECEDLESKGVYRGNGHHLAQRICRLVAEGLLKPQQRKIFSSLTTAPATTREIAEKCGLSSKVVSSQLIQISNRTLLVNKINGNGKLKKWAKISY
jgi:hypothetical protein